MQENRTIRRTWTLDNIGTVEDVQDLIDTAAARFRRDTGKLVGETPGWLKYEGFTFWYEYTPGEAS